MSNIIDYPSMQRIAELQQLIADFANIFRVLDIADKKRKENDVEHSYGLALTCWFLAPKIAPKLNLEKILKYALAHDIVELYAGDTFVFGPQSELDSKSDREDAALEKISQDWPDFSELTQYAKDYKDHTDSESNFVYTIDKILPPLMVNLGEKDEFWSRNKITKEMHEAEKKKKMQYSPEALPFLNALNEWLMNPDYFYKKPPHE